MTLLISPLEGEMSPKATEGVGTTGRDLLSQTEEAGASRAATPSGLPAISEGEIPNHLDYRHDCCTISVHKLEGCLGEAGV
jgi:hypothetical protein